MHIIIYLISIFLDGAFNIIFPYSILCSLFSILSLIIIYPFFNNKIKYIKFSLIFGLIYDILFTNFYIFNIFIFFIISVIIYYFFNKNTYNLFNVFILNIIIIHLYIILVLIMFNISNYGINLFSELIFILPHFYISNIIYIIISYLFIDRIIIINKHKLY